MLKVFVTSWDGVASCLLLCFEAETSLLKVFFCSSISCGINLSSILSSKNTDDAQIYFVNAIPQVDKFVAGGYTKEEMKMVFETRKILNVPEMKITATCVRLPILRSHSESILVETEKKLMPKEAIKLWEQAGLKVQNKEEAGGYPTPREVTKTFNTHIGRVREDLSSEKALCFWCVADQLYKGAALNAIEIAEEYFFLRNQNLSLKKHE